MTVTMENIHIRIEVTTRTPLDLARVTQRSTYGLVASMLVRHRSNQPKSEHDEASIAYGVHIPVSPTFTG